MQKCKYAIEHFKELNNRLLKKEIKQKYFFNFLSPGNFNEYFTYLRDGRLIEGTFVSELDISFAKEEEL